MLLWGLALLFVLPQIGAAIAVAVEGKEMLGKRRPGMATACFLGALLWGSLWLVGMWFCGTRGYAALASAIG